MNDTPTTETYDKDEILESLKDLQDRLEGLRYILENAEFSEVEVNIEQLALRADGSRRVSRRKGC